MANSEYPLHIELKLERSVAYQLLQVLTNEIRVSRFRADLGATKDQTALVKLASDLERQLRERYVTLIVLSVDETNKEVER